MKLKKPRNEFNYQEKFVEYENQAARIICRKALEWLWKPHGIMTKK